MKEFKNFRELQLPLLENEIEKAIEKYTANQRLQEAMLYSVHAGGKRIRPLLLLAAVTAFDQQLTSGDYYMAASVEMIHTYSLIHDDLPAMDDDDLRRGKPTNHKVFGEAHAILAGDGLLTLAFQLLSYAPIDLDKKVLLLQLLAKSSGTEGMVAGQAGDLQGEEKQLTLEQLAEVHELKTGALIELSLVAGGILANQTEEIVQLLSVLAKHLGLAFQIRDDLLDVLSTQEELGKVVGRDQQLNKSTYPALLGVEGAKQALTEELNNGQKVIEQIQQMTSNFNPVLLQEFLEQLTLN